MLKNNASFSSSAAASASLMHEGDGARKEEIK
jgi:hypothetical protein